MVIMLTFLKQYVYSPCPFTSMSPFNPQERYELDFIITHIL